MEDIPEGSVVSIEPKISRELQPDTSTTRTEIPEDGNIFTEVLHLLLILMIS